MPSLLEKVNHQEAQITAKEDKKILSQLSKIPEKRIMQLIRLLTDPSKKISRFLQKSMKMFIDNLRKSTRIRDYQIIAL